MVNFAFISDFDGTLTEKDFYKIIMDEYLKEECTQMYKDWRSKKIKDIDYLGYVFKNMRRNEKEIDEDIMRISFDPYVKSFVQKVKSVGGDFVVISAGTSYYINKIFQKEDIQGVDVYSNEAVYRDKGIHFVLDENSEFYSDIYGIDKSKVVEKLKKKYDKIFYAGDTEPDLKAALLADVVFAKDILAELLKKEKKECIEFENFSEVWPIVENYIKEWNENEG